MSDTQRIDTERGMEPAAHNNVNTYTTGVITRPISPPPPYQQGSATTVPVVPIRQHNDPPRVIVELNWKKSCNCSGLLQGVCGFLCLALGLVTIALDCQLSDTGMAVWSGVWIIFTGFLGVSASRNPAHLCLVTMYMIFSFFGIMCGFGIVTVYCTAAIKEERLLVGPEPETASPYAARVAINSVLAFVGVIAISSAIWGLVMSSRKVCKEDFHDPRARMSYYCSSTSADLRILNTEDTSPPQYQPDTDTFQVPGQIAEEFQAYGLPPSYQASQSEKDKTKNRENEQSSVLP